MNALDRIIGFFSPKAAFDRARYRQAVAAYDGAQPSRLRKFSRDQYSGDYLSRTQTRALRNQAREMDRNHDIARGGINILVNNIVGPRGIGIEPQPRSVSGEILDDLAAQLLVLWRDFCRVPEVTHQLDWAATCRLAARTWVRDGEFFTQLVEGSVPNYEHGTQVPFSLELLEPDMVPTDADFPTTKGTSAIVRNGWGQPIAYWVYKAHPGDGHLWQVPGNLKRIPADRMLHCKRVDRIGQSRGVSELASVITRLEDLKDYEESERIAAKIAASMAAYIKKGVPEDYQPQVDANGKPIRRDMRFAPGMIFDDLSPGEEVGTIDTNRPNTQLQAHRDGQLRAAAGGFNVSYSSLSRNYNGTWSAQRQELVEQWVNYETIGNEFVRQFVVPVWERFVALANIAGLLDIPADLDPKSLDDALFIGQVMPWIDPSKEASANETLEANTYMSGLEIIRRRGGNPQDVIDQQARWQRMKKKAGLLPTADSAAPPATLTSDEVPNDQQ